MRRKLMIGVAAGFLATALSACGGTDVKPWSASFRQEVVAGCLDTAPAGSEDYCNCAVDYAAARLRQGEVTLVDGGLPVSDKVQKVMADAIEECR
jgi:hypothetical protein